MANSSSSLVAKTFAGGRERLRADPSICISDLVGAFESVFEEHGSRDLRKILDPPAEMDWKSSPATRWICKHKVLFSKLLSVAPNTIVTSKKLREALQRLQETEPINYTKKDNSDFYDWIDVKVRVGLSMLRELKNNFHQCFDRAMKRMTDEEKEVLGNMMKKIVLSKDQTLSSSPQQVDSQEDSQQSINLQLVPVVNSESPHSSPLGGTKKNMEENEKSEEPSAVFKQILKNKRRKLSSTSSDPTSPEVCRRRLSFGKKISQKKARRK